MTRKRLVRAGAWLLALALVGAALYRLRGQWHAAADVARDLRPRWGLVALSGALVLATYVTLAETWRRVLGTLGETLPLGEALRMWFVSSLARYIPGALWQIGALGAMAQQRGISPVAVAGSAVLMTVVNVLTGAVVVVALGGAGLLGTRGWMVVVAGVVALALVPVATPRLARVASRLTGRDVALPAFGARAVWVACLGNVLAWGGYGVAFWLLATGTVGAHAGPLPYVAIYTFAYLVGFLSLGPPAGVGVAEGAMIFAFATFGVGTAAEAGVLAVVARLWRTALETLPGILLLASRPRTARPSAESTR